MSMWKCIYIPTGLALFVYVLYKFYLIVHSNYETTGDLSHKHNIKYKISMFLYIVERMLIIFFKGKIYTVYSYK